MEIRETHVFTRQILGSGEDEEYRLLQWELVQNPELGVVIQGTGGLRKLRWKAEGRGKRGGRRIIYYWAVERSVILMLFMFPKNAQADLTPEQKRKLRQLVEAEFGAPPRASRQGTLRHQSRHASSRRKE
jgi:mRNA-degrading endonuclease RelE of RelBE toxin-antitoxin system